MAFVGGLMGPYMRPIPVGAPAAMGVSLLIAFAVTPWAAARALRSRSSAGEDHAHEGTATRAYRWFMSALFARRAAWFLATSLCC